MNNKIVIPIIIAALAVGAAGGYWLSGAKTAQPMAEQKAAEPEREVLFWRNPMNPDITSPVFTKDQMGMDYIPVYADDGSGTTEPAGTVTIDPVTVQNIGVRTARAEIRDLSRSLNSLGRVDFDEEKLARLHPKTSGWIETLRIDETGTQVDRDTILLSIYSPELVVAEQEYLVALNNWEAVRDSSAAKVRQNARTVLDSALERLQLFDVPAHQIRELQQDRKLKKQLHIHSPFKGRVMKIGAREGQYVSPKDELYLIADLSRIWVNVDVFEDEMSWVKVGDRAEMQVRADPGRTYEGRVTFIHPILNPTSRTVPVRLEFDNPDLMLKPGMYANVTLYSDTQRDAVVVPSEAIVRSGSRDQVFVVRAPGKFEPREVTLGVSAQGQTQILSGLQAGERVVTSSQFLIDSESKLREATAKMTSPEPDDPTAMDMPGSSQDGMNMDDMNMDDMSMDDMSMDDMSMDDMDMSGMKME